MTAYDLGHILTYKVNCSGDSVSPKKLQKLLYYVEAWHLVHLGKPILEEDFQAWVHGPVLPSLYGALKEYGFNDIKVINSEGYESIETEIQALISKNHISDDQLELIDTVLLRYGALSSFQLEFLTHHEKPWLEARGDLAPHNPSKTVISKEAMRQYYSAQISGKE